MAQRPRITIFHLYRKDGTALFLHPFDNLDKLISILNKCDIEGKYGKEPRVESLTLFRNDLYRMIEEAVKSWVAEARFIPRFLISAGIFLITYLFLSFVVRDPLPLVDEILIAGGAAFAGYFFLSRRDQKSNAALKMRVRLRTAVDRITFREDPFVREVESALQRNESESRERVLTSMVQDIDKAFQNADEDDVRQLFRYLERRFNTKEYRKQEKLLSRAKGAEGAAKSVESLSKWSESKKIDLSLFAVYRRMKKSVRKVK